MNYRELINRSISHMQHIHAKHHTGYYDVFGNGGVWMRDRLIELNYRDEPMSDSVSSFRFYGYFKYGVCLLFFFLAIGGFYKLNIFLTPLAILVFYWCEAHFVFLFPLLIEGAKRPVIESIRAAYKIGVLRIMVTVIPIAVYMIAGLFNRSAPLYKWYVGCLAILIWYKHEVRDRP